MSNSVFPAKVRGLTWTINRTLMGSTDIVKSANGYENRLALWQNPMWKWQFIYDYIWDDPDNLVSGLTFTDLRTLIGFLMARQLDFDDFLLNDPNDNVIGPPIWVKGSFYFVGDVIIDPAGHTQTAMIGGFAGSTLPAFTSGGAVVDGQVTWQGSGAFVGASAQVLTTVNDGAGSPTYYSPIQRNYGGQFLEDITDQNTTVYPSIRVWDNGVLKALGSDYTIVGPGLAIPGHSYMGLVIQWAAAPTTPVTASGQFYFRVRFSDAKQDYEQFTDLLYTIGGSENKNGKSTLDIESSRIASI